MSKSAKEMFEELGYHYDKTSKQIVIFETWYNGFSELHHQELMRFKNIDSKWWKLIPKRELVLNFNKEIDINLFKAINKQIEELWWLDEQSK